MLCEKLFKIIPNCIFLKNLNIFWMSILVPILSLYPLMSTQDFCYFIPVDSLHFVLEFEKWLPFIQIDYLRMGKRQRKLKPADVDVDVDVDVIPIPKRPCEKIRKVIADNGDEAGVNPIPSSGKGGNLDPIPGSGKVVNPDSISLEESIHEDDSDKDDEDSDENPADQIPLFSSNQGFQSSSFVSPPLRQIQVSKSTGASIVSSMSRSEHSDGSIVLEDPIEFRHMQIGTFLFLLVCICLIICFRYCISRKAKEDWAL